MSKQQYYWCWQLRHRGSSSLLEAMGEGSNNKGEGGKTYLFCTIHEEVERARVSDDTRTVGRRRMYY